MPKQSSSKLLELNTYLQNDGTLSARAVEASTVLPANTSAFGIHRDANVLDVSAIATNIGKAVYSGGQQDLNIFLWGDFLAAIVGSTDRNADSNSIAP